MGSLINVSGRIFNTPLLIHPGKAEAILWGIRERLSIDVPQPQSSRFMGSSRRTDGTWGLFRMDRGVAIIDVYGTLVNRGAYLGENNSGMTSYEGLRAQITAAAKDQACGAICLVIDSPGGEAGGMKAVADALLEARGSKRIVAVVDDMAASAAYGIASAAHEIWVSQTSTVGSIGVVLVHMDHSAELQMAGIRPTIIKAGAKKAAGNPFQPLSDDAAAELADLVGKHYEAFIATVAAGRGGKCSAKQCRATEAAVFVGADAISRGLADRIGTVEQAVDYLAKRSQGIVPGATGASKMQDDEVILARETAHSGVYVFGSTPKGAADDGDARDGNDEWPVEAYPVANHSPAPIPPVTHMSETLDDLIAQGRAFRASDWLASGKPLPRRLSDIAKKPAAPGACWHDVHAAVAREFGFTPMDERRSSRDAATPGACWDDVHAATAKALGLAPVNEPRSAREPAKAAASPWDDIHARTAKELGVGPRN